MDTLLSAGYLDIRKYHVVSPLRLILSVSWHLDHGENVIPEWYCWVVWFTLETDESLERALSALAKFWRSIQAGDSPTGRPWASSAKFSFDASRVIHGVYIGSLGRGVRSTCVSVITNNYDLDIEYLDIDDIVKIIRRLRIGLVSNLGLLDSVINRPSYRLYGEVAHPSISLKTAVIMHLRVLTSKLVRWMIACIWL